MRPHDALKQDRRALPLGRLPGPKPAHDPALEPLREQRRGRRPQRVHDAETVRVAATAALLLLLFLRCSRRRRRRRRRGANDAVDARSVLAPREEGERFARQQRGGQAARARPGAGREVRVVLDGDPRVSLGVERLEARGVADDEGQDAEVLVLFRVDFRSPVGPVGVVAGWGGRAVVAEHADEGRGAVGLGQGGAGGYEGGEDVRVEVEGAGDGRGDLAKERAGQVPGGLELGLEERGAVRGGFDRHDGLLVGDLREAFFAGGGPAGGLVVGLFGGVGGQVEEFGGLGEELGVCFYHSWMVG